MSLRELPPEQQITDRWRHLRYVPLVILVVLVVVATGVGLWARGNQPAPTPEFPDDSAEGPIVEGDRLPDACRPPVSRPTTQPWRASMTASSQAVWDSHADELAGSFVVGEDDWIFWNDVQSENFSQAVGRRTLTEDEIARWREYISTTDAELAALGIEFYVVVAPAKWAVYPENLPDWAQEIRGEGPLDQLMDAGGDLPLVDLRATVQEASTEGQTYSSVNSHWGSYGAWSGWNGILECLNANQPELGLEPIPLVEVKSEPPSNEFAPFGIPDPSDEPTGAVLDHEWLPIEVRAAGAEPQVVDGNRITTFPELPARTVTEGAASDLSVLLLEDSFGIGMTRYLQQAFGETSQARHNIDGDPATRPDIVELATATRPDIVILEVAQRYLTQPPASSGAPEPTG